MAKFPSATDGNSRISLSDVVKILKNCTPSVKALLWYIDDPYTAVSNLLGIYAERYAREGVLSRSGGTKRTWGGSRKQFVSNIDCIGLLWEILVVKLDEAIEKCGVFARGRCKGHDLWISTLRSTTRKRTMTQNTLQRRRVVMGWLTHDIYTELASLISSRLRSPSCLDYCDVPDCVSYISAICESSCNVRPDTTALQEMVSALCVNCVEPSLFLAKTLVRTYTMECIVGKSLSASMRIYEHAREFSLDVAMPSISEAQTAILNELVAARKEIADLKAEAASRINSRPIRMSYDVIGNKAIATVDRRKRSPEFFSKMTGALQFLLTSRGVFTRAPDTLREAAQFLAAHTSSYVAESARMDKLFSDRSLRRHAVLVDDAIDALTSKQIAAARDDNSLLGCAVSSDESPPGDTRFAGLRFQITIVHVCFAEPIASWEDPKYSHNAM